MSNVAASADPPDFQWLIIIVVVSVCPGVSTILARHPFGMGLPGGGARNTSLPILRIAVISVVSSLSYSVAVTLVESPDTAPNRVAPRLAKIAASFRAEAATWLDSVELDSAEFASFEHGILHAPIIDSARQKSNSTAPRGAL